MHSGFFFLKILRMNEKLRTKQTQSKLKIEENFDEKQIQFSNRRDT